MDRVVYRLNDVTIEATTPFDSDFIVTLTHALRGWSETHIVEKKDWETYEKWLDQTSFFITCPIRADGIWFVPEQLFFTAQKENDDRH